ncbi:aldolase/citrate lyase family protein [Streptomyces lydicus]|nr:aldolase/citrate lyase family protein [Streptomyces lydicus]
MQGPADIHRAAAWATTAAQPAAGPALTGRLATGRRACTPRPRSHHSPPAPPTPPAPHVPRAPPAPPGRPPRERHRHPHPRRPGPAALPATPALYALLESALGIEHAFAIATAHPALRGIALGEADLATELGVRDEAGLAWPRSRTVVAARAAGLAPPPQSVYPDVADLEGLARSCARGRALGFLGRAAIHPRQLPVIEAAHLPSPEEVEAAAEIVRAAGAEGGAQALPDGRFVDAAVVAGARRVLSLAERRN